MSKEREALRAVAQALRVIAADPELRAKLPAMPPRLASLARTVDNVLSVNVWEQTPTLQEWKDRVEAVLSPEQREHVRRAEALAEKYRKARAEGGA